MTSAASLHFILVPSYWLGGWAWDQVRVRLVEAGHEVRSVTLPKLEESGPSAEVTLEDQVAAVVAAVRETTRWPRVLVGHSGAGALVHAGTDRLPELVSAAIYVDSGPLPDGTVGMPDLDPSTTAIPLPTWQELEAQGSNLAGLDADDLAEFRRRAVPHPAGPAREPLRLANPRRYDVPITLISSSFRPAQIRSMIAAGHPFFAELVDRDFAIVDLPTGHWPMWSRPAELAEALVEAARAQRPA